MDASATMLALLELIAPTLGIIKSVIVELYVPPVAIGRDCFDSVVYPTHCLICAQALAGPRDGSSAGPLGDELQGPRLWRL